ncbi:hypothetical protein TIFTF001_003055 [Ficus carica]|uniref:PHD-type domain-containing protein n=1 Tax=Ficus carica TaxID=3494 RepID=A0AA88CV50_FICCA|nr:hypothetical protein TIFTF001_003055 [Ficus carica]
MQERRFLELITMAYELRDRQRNKAYKEISASNSEEESDSVHDDPDFYRPVIRQRRQPQLVAVPVVDPNMNAAAESATRRRPGRPPRNAAPAPEPSQVTFMQFPRRKRKRRARLLLQRPSGEDKRTVLAWMIDMELIKENQLVLYMDKVVEKITLHGLITRAGILCSCCEKVVTASDFEVHAQSHKRGEPYKQIFLQNGRSLFQYLVKAWYDGIDDIGPSMLENFELGKDASDKSDDACIVCADGGDLICCKNCPSTFHFSCLKLERVPEGDWLCPYCVCKHCELSEGIPEDFSKCILCGKKYHLACYVLNEFNLNTNCKQFCGQDCEEVYEKMQKMMGAKNELGEGSKLNRIDFRGFCTAVLEKDDEIICAASLRLHGKKMVEMPFVATDRNYRRKGMMKKLLVAIESAMYFMEVENLVLPSAQKVVTMWINKFHFSRTIPKFLEQDVVRSNMLMFPQSVKLHKSLVSSITAMEIDQVGDNEGKAPESSSKKVLPFDLNLVSPEENEDVIMM